MAAWKLMGGPGDWWIDESLMEGGEWIDGQADR